VISRPCWTLLTARLAFTKNGVLRLSAPPTPDLSKFKTDKKITDEEILKLLEQPMAKEVKTKNKKKKASGKKEGEETTEA
jgi:hypothetical protein